MSGKRTPAKPTVVEKDEPKPDVQEDPKPDVVEPTQEPVPDGIEPSEPSTEPTPNIIEPPAPDTQPATQEPLVEVTGMGKKYFNDIKRVIPYQHTDGDPLGDTPIQSR